MIPNEIINKGLNQNELIPVVGIDPTK